MGKVYFIMVEYLLILLHARINILRYGNNFVLHRIVCELHSFFGCYLPQGRGDASI